jgi:hypothetical protein
LGRNLSKAQNPCADGKNIADQAGNRPKSNSLQVANAITANQEKWRSSR